MSNIVFPVLTLDQGYSGEVKKKTWTITSPKFLVPLLFAFIFVVVGLWGMYFNRVSVGSPIDDGLIHVRSAEMLVTHGVLSFNVHERVEASSSLLYTLVITLGFIAGVSHEGIVEYLLFVGTLVSTGTILLLYLLVRRQASEGWAVFGSLLLAFCPAMGYWSASVMETPLNTFLELALISSILFLEDGKKTGKWALVLCGLLVLVRPDGFFLPLCIALYLFGKKGEWRLSANIFAITATVFLLIGLLRQFYYGKFFPSPVYAKTGMPFGDAMEGAIVGWNQFFIPSGMWILMLPLVGIFLAECLSCVIKAWRLKNPFTELSLVPWIATGMILYWWLHGGDGYGVRMLLTLFPLGIYQWVVVLSKSGKVVKETSALALVLIGALIFVPLHTFPGYYDFRGANLSPAPILSRDKAIAEVLRKNHPTIKSGTADKLGFISYAVGPDVEMYDLIGGLADPVLAHMEPQKAVSGKVVQGHCKFDLKHTLDKKPDFVYMLANSYPSLSHPFIPGLNKDYLTEEGYELGYISSCLTYKVVDVRQKDEDQLGRYFRSSGEYNIMVFLKKGV